MRCRVEAGRLEAVGADVLGGSCNCHGAIAQRRGAQVGRVVVLGNVSQGVGGATGWGRIGDLG
ncbi:hypothetical protein D9M72_282770 [compost metagenome]